MSGLPVGIALSVLLTVLILGWWQPAGARTFKLALPGYRFSFPADFAAHEDYKTEWWYYTGHLKTDDGAKFGYELTFFRVGMDVAHGVVNSPWTMKDVYLAHFAVTDFAGKRFFHQQRMNRAGLGAAGADTARYHVWNQDWSARQAGGLAVAGAKPPGTVGAVVGSQLLQASCAGYGIDLHLRSLKPPVVHGLRGVSQKAACDGCASHYYSLTRLATDGQIMVGGRSRHVTGLSWMDHEFGSNQLTAEQVGWDWFSIQLSDNRELMLYVMRHKDQSADLYSSGTMVAEDGTARHLSAAEFSIKPTGTWHSFASGGTYPIGWQISVPCAGLELAVSPALSDQELTRQGASDVTYWEGACQVDGTSRGLPVHGQSYVEMTGYAGAFRAHI